MAATPSSSFGDEPAHISGAGAVTAGSQKEVRAENAVEVETCGRREATHLPSAIGGACQGNLLDSR